MLQWIRHLVGRGSNESLEPGGAIANSRAVISAAGSANPEAVTLAAQLAKMLATSTTRLDPQDIAKVILAGPGAEINMCFGNDLSHERAEKKDPGAARWQKTTFGENHLGYVNFTVSGTEHEVAVRKRVFLGLGACGQLLGGPEGFTRVKEAEDDKAHLGPSGVVAACVPTTNPRVTAVVLSAGTEGEDPMCRATRATMRFFLPADLATRLVEDIKVRSDGIDTFGSIMSSLRAELVAGKVFVAREIR